MCFLAERDPRTRLGRGDDGFEHGRRMEYLVRRRRERRPALAVGGEGFHFGLDCRHAGIGVTVPGFLYETAVGQLGGELVMGENIAPVLGGKDR